ncbi:MAG: AraC family transcriptional regulator, partial [Victivallales bacterium]|nr:AraC family transcriptional regulator [Victivallales bacterium]
DFITRSLVRKASLLLGGAVIPVKEVADRLHFNSEYYFSRFFKQQTGMSPREFQRHSGTK